MYAINQNLESLQNENISLKNQIQIYQEKEKSYQSSIYQIKKIQNEYESSYQQSINDYKKHEEEIKQKYFEYQKILENQNEENEKRLSDEIISLKNELKGKDNIINSLNVKINALNEKMSKEELNYYFKEKEYEDIIISKERKLSELNDAIKQIVQEATEEIKRLSEQLEEFQNRIKLNHPMNFLIEREAIENNYNLGFLNRSVDDIKNNNANININSIKSFKQNDIVKQSQNIINNSMILSEKFKNAFKDGNNNIATPLKGNNSFIINNKFVRDNPSFYTQNNFYNNRNNNNNNDSNNQDLMAQLYLLQNDKNLLANELRQKEKEVNFWKNLRNDIYSKNQTHINSANNSINFSTSINDLKLKNMEKTLANYGTKINRIKKQYNKSLKYHQMEIDQLRNDMENSVNMTYNKVNDVMLNTNSYEDNENDSSEQIKSTNENLLNSLKITIPSKEGIRNEYIKSQVQKIKNSENFNNKE